MAPTQRKKKHHFRPVLQLQHFVGPDGKIWVYNRLGGVPFPQIPKNIGYERLLYAPGDGPDPTNDALENWFERAIDTPAAGALRKLIEKQGITNVERSALAAFIAAQDMRTPKARDVLVSLFQAGLDREYEGWKTNIGQLRAAIKRDSGLEFDPADLRRVLGMYTLEVNKGVWLDFIVGNVNRAGERIFSMGWSLVDAPPGGEFLTNDVGLVKCYGSPAQPTEYGLGFAAGCTHWIVPLSPGTALVLTPDEEGFIGVGRRDWVEAVNRQVVLDAERFVYSRSPTEQVEQWWRTPDTAT